MTHHLVIGIDPGVNTGVALLDAEQNLWLHVGAMKIHEAMQMVMAHNSSDSLSHVVFEDARLRKWFGTKRGTKEDLARKQGAGSVKRDCTIWADFLGGLNIPFKTISPQGKGAKLDAETFKRITGWQGRTNEHGRDAASLVIGAKALKRTEN